MRGSSRGGAVPWKPPRKRKGCRQQLWARLSGVGFDGGVRCDPGVPKVTEKRAKQVLLFSTVLFLEQRPPARGT